MLMKMFNQTRGNIKGEPKKYLPAGLSSLELSGSTSDCSCSLSVSDSTFSSLVGIKCVLTKSLIIRWKWQHLKQEQEVLWFESVVTHLFKNCCVMMHKDSCIPVLNRPKAWK